MIKTILKYTVLFIFLVLLQVLLLNNIQFSGYINPYLYILFILLLPFETPKWLLLVLAFVLGLCIDIFSSTMGLHIAATVFMAFCRPFVLKLIAPRDGYDSNQEPGIQDFDLRWFVSYAAALTILHHFVLFYLEIFRFSDFFYTFNRMLFSSIFSILLILLSQLFSYNSQSKR